jgi:hypothetical protein
MAQMRTAVTWLAAAALVAPLLAGCAAPAPPSSAPLARPRLVLPGDVKGARYVSDVVELHVLHATPTSWAPVRG